MLNKGLAQLMCLEDRGARNQDQGNHHSIRTWESLQDCNKRKRKKEAFQTLEIEGTEIWRSENVSWPIAIGQR